MYCFTRKVNGFTRKVNCVTRTDKCFTRKTLDKWSFWPYTTNCAYNYDNVLRVIQMVLCVKQYIKI